MFPVTRILIALVSALSTAVAGTVVVTTLPDESHPLAPLTSLNGTSLASGANVSVGAFPGMTDDEIVDAASSGGLTQIDSAFRTFGSTQSFGDGVDGVSGNFEIAAKQATPAPATPWAGEEVSFLIKHNGGQEFLVMRFKGKLFEIETDTGLEPLLTLHLADAKVIVGNRYGSRRISTSFAPAAGSFNTWIDGFAGITDPLQRTSEADADGDGRSNFLEYATGGDPSVPAEPPPCQLLPDESGAYWVRFPQAIGVGVTQSVETSGDLVSTWVSLDETIEPDPDHPATEGLQWMRVRVPQPMETKGFFRLKAQP